MKREGKALLAALAGLAAFAALARASAGPTYIGTAEVGPLEPVGPIGNTDPNALALDPSVKMPPYVPIEDRAWNDPVWGSGVKPDDLAGSKAVPGSIPGVALVF